MRTRILHRWKTVFLGDYWEYLHCRHRPEGTDYTPTPEESASPKRISKMVSLVYFCIGEYYSMFGQGEWYMNTANIDCHEYAKAASGFYPSRFNAQEWVAAIKASGAKYICITSRHHDGFSMFDTKIFRL